MSLLGFQAASVRKGREILDTLGRYSVLEDQSDTHPRPDERAWRTIRKAFNHDLRCYVALTVIPKAALPNEESWEQFTREVRIADGIRHPNIVSVFPLESIEESYLYAMEFCDGETLTDRIRQSDCFETIDALNIVQQIAAGLEAASSAGLLHRDITADNIVLLQEDHEIEAKVLGLALPSRGAAERLSTAAEKLDFRSPEEIAGNDIDVRSGIFSLGALLYLMEAGPEKYALFRAQLLENESENPLAHDKDSSHRIRMVVIGSVCHDPKQRISTFAELVDAIDRARTAPEPSTVQAVAIVRRTNDIARNQIIPPSEIARPPEVVEETPPIKMATKSTEPRPGELMIPPELVQVAQPGRVLRLNRVGTKSHEQVVAYVGTTFRFGRSAGLELVTRILPRNKTNDTKTKRLGRTHIIAKCEGNQILFFDGDGIKASANGSTFQTKALSFDKPTALVNAGTLQLAEIYSIKVIPLFWKANEVPAIVNLSDWSGPIVESNTALTGAILFHPNEKNGGNTTLWLFSTATFGVSGASPLDFALPAEEPKIGALRYLRGCFWIEQKSTESLLIDDIRLDRGEIAPLAAGQTIEVKGIKYRVEIQSLSGN